MLDLCKQPKWQNVDNNDKNINKTTCFHVS